LFVFRPHLVREARDAAGMTREQLAVAIGRSFQTVRAYEWGVVSPPAAMLGRLASVLDVDVSDLFEDVPAAAGGDAA
jgi:transcriptional regulator with XRE-family HTH domain